MERQEWTAWHEDFSKRFPECGMYIANLPIETRDLWFEELFSKYPQVDAMQMTLRFMKEGEGFNRFERDKLYGKLAQYMMEEAYKREQREKPQHHYGGETKLMKRDAITGTLYRRIMSKIEEHKQQHGKRPTDDQIEAWSDSASAEFDNRDDDFGRFRCPRCCDLGVVSFERKGKSLVGACSCELGCKIQSRAYRSGRKLGAAPLETQPEENQFNKSLISEFDES